MRKWSVYIIVLLLVLVALIYILIPGTLKVREEIIINANPYGLARVLASPDNWEKWWPAQMITQTPEGNSLKLNGFSYNVGSYTMEAVEMKIARTDTFKSQLNIFYLSPDTSGLGWNCAITSGLSPISRLKNYFLARELKSNFEEILNSMNQYVSHKPNIYHTEIKLEKVKDSVMMATRSQFSDTPSVADVYAMVSKLRKYIANHKGTETNYPMLHVEKGDDSSYWAMVAIPVNHSLPESGDISLKRMLYDGKILEAEVKGGSNRIANTMKWVKNYMNDYKYSAPAIPFELMVTDRLAEPDSSHWVTRIYFPVY